MERILLVEDDERLAPLVKQFLEDNRFEVTWISDGHQASRQFRNQDWALVVLDLMLPGKDGLTLCREFRESSDAGVLILTARGDEMDRILGLDLGADDYLTKPFSLAELLARIRAIMRRCGTMNRTSELIRTLGTLSIDLVARKLFRNEESIELTRSEFDILDRLTRKPGWVLSREDLLQEIRGGETDAFDRAVDTHISNLRAKIEEDPKHPKLIKTVWGVGYQWVGA